MYGWFMQVRSEGQTISGPIICGKALKMNKQLNGNPDFKATTGWLQCFKFRHGIRELDIQGKKLSVDYEAAEHFKQTYEEMVKKDVNERRYIYNVDDIYNVFTEKNSNNVSR